VPMVGLVRTRLSRDEGGFGLIELIIALTVLNVGILATVAALNSGALALQRASKQSTATAIADAQMELYRAILYDAIMLDATELAVDDDDTTYTGDAAYRVDSPDNLSMETGTCVSPLPNECNPVRTVVGPDGKSYRVDTYIVETAPVADSRAVKIVTVVVRDATNLSKSLVRAESTFDESTGSPAS
jgi:type II secretory pathway pseudopilin PulG